MKNPLRSLVEFTLSNSKYNVAWSFIAFFVIIISAVITAHLIRLEYGWWWQLAYSLVGGFIAGKLLADSLWLIKKENEIDKMLAGIKELHRIATINADIDRTVEQARSACHNDEYKRQIH